MWPTLLAGSFGVVGVVVGQVLGRRTEHQKWLRSQRQEAYLDVIAFADEFAMSGMIQTTAREIFANEFDSFIIDATTNQLRRLPGVDTSQLDRNMLRPEPAQLESIKKDAWKTAASTLGIPETPSDLIGAVRRADQVIAAVALVAPSDVATAAQELATMTKALLDLDESREVGYEDWRQQRQQFIRLARQDMSVKGDPPLEE